MLKKVVVFSLFCGWMSHCLLADEPALGQPPVFEQNREMFQIPEEFFVKQRWLSWSSSFDVETRTQKFGTIHRRIFSLTIQYDYYDAYDKLQANARMRFFSFGAAFDVTDADQNLIGSVHEYIFTFFPTFEIISAENHTQVIAKLNFWGTKYTLRDPVTQEEIALLSRPFFSFRDHWKVTITNPKLFAQKKIDPRLFVVVMVFQTDKDNWRAQRNANSLQMTIDDLTMDESLVSGFKELRNELEVISRSMETAEPSDEDILFIENYVEDYLTAHERNAGSIGLPNGFEEGMERIEQQRIYYGLTQVIPLLTQEWLTPAQKGALLYMIDGQLKQMGY